MFGFHKPKMYRSLDGCCICRAKSSSSRFTDSRRYEKDFTSCFGLSESRTGDICNACVLLVKRWKKLPVGSKKNWNHVVDARGGPSLKISSRPKKTKSLLKKARPRQISRLQKELKRNNSDAHSTTSSTSPAQSPSYSNLSDEGSDTDIGPGSSQPPVFSFLDLTYWKRQKVCCGIIYKGRFGEVLIDPHLFKPCCRKQQRPTPPAPQGAGAGYLEDEEEDEEEEEEEVDVEEAASVSEVTAERSTPKNGLEEVLKGALEEEVVVVKEEVVVKEDELNTGTMQLLLAAV
ncbi:SIN3-HDAC complex-associated factor-like [Gadus chalcogrammus]|uniref:SIN3-HDAC complex-associated factor-like n=1 Tax=Gadus chalcogrammus TaxID=1042646 RepID=UPI0024C482BF|nr:SIN3-HDAC complex-associated factor-like [Gadus chalcogrammus]XP_056454041.1 SIN3-HDAC complex-associated factor-like [Gadus chalcogrammus]XP_056454042.1 SIN3-HDAC complex-associated factor-like [Gadus chalcogrammus]